MQKNTNRALEDSPERIQKGAAQLTDGLDRELVKECSTKTANIRYTFLLDTGNKRFFPLDNAWEFLFMVADILDRCFNLFDKRCN